MTPPRRAACQPSAMNMIDSPRARQFAWLALGAYLVGLGISATLRSQGDFNVYYRAGYRALHGLAIYPPDDSDRFLYAPIFAIGFAPLAALPRHLAQFVFFAVNAFSLVELILGAGVMLFGRARRLPAALIVVPVLLSVRFINNNFEHGQINLPTLALIVWAIVYSDESHSAWAGLMIAAAILIKPFAILAALHLAIRRHFDALGWAMVAGIALLIVPIVVFGPRGWLDQTGAYATAIASMTNRYRMMLTNQSAVSAFARILSLRVGSDAETSATATIVGMGFEMLLVAAVSLWDWKSDEKRKFRESPRAVRLVLPDALVRADFVEKLLRGDARAVHGSDRGVVDRSRHRRESADFRLHAVRAFRRAQSRGGKLSEPHRPLLLGAFPFIVARTRRRVRTLASRETTAENFT